MSPKTEPLPDESEMAVIRESSLARGRSLVVGASTEATAYVRCGHLTRKYPAAETSLEFRPGTYEMEPGLAEALDIPGGIRHVVYAYPAPLLDPRDHWDAEADTAILGQLQRWGDRVLVRTYRSRNAASTRAYNVRATLEDDHPGLVKAGVTVISATIGTQNTGHGALFGMFAVRAS